MAEHYAIIRPATETYRVFVGAELLFETQSVLEVEEHFGETTAPIVPYFSPNVMDILTAQKTQTTSRCPLKGQANYWRHHDVDDAIWSYPKANNAVAEISGYVAFDTHKGFRVERGEENKQ